MYCLPCSSAPTVVSRVRSNVPPSSTGTSLCFCVADLPSPYVKVSNVSQQWSELECILVRVLCVALHLGSYRQQHVLSWRTRGLQHPRRHFGGHPKSCTGYTAAVTTATAQAVGDAATALGTTLSHGVPNSSSISKKEFRALLKAMPSPVWATIDYAIHTLVHVPYGHRPSRFC